MHCNNLLGKNILVVLCSCWQLLPSVLYETVHYIFVGFHDKPTGNSSGTHSCYHRNQALLGLLYNLNMENVNVRLTLGP